MKLHTLLVVMLLATTTAFASVMAPSEIVTNQFSYVETWEQNVTLTNVLLTYHPDVGNNEFRLDLITDTGTKSIDMIPSGIFDINPNIMTDVIEVKLLRRVNGSGEPWVPTTQFNYEWNIPEPATLGLLLSGGFVVMVFRRFKNS